MTTNKTSPSRDLEYRLDVGRNAKHLLVLLHGYGGTQHGISSLGPEVDPDGRFAVLSPRAPIERPGGGASWYDFDATTWLADAESFRAGLAKLDRLLGTTCDQVGLDRSTSVVGGFSQGAGMAAWLAFGDPAKSAGALWCCGTVVEVEGKALDLSGARGRSALFLAGLSDEHVPIERTRSAAKRFDDAGLDVTLSEHPGGHGISRAMTIDMKRWLAGYAARLRH